MVDDRETRSRYRADQLVVFRLAFVGAQGGETTVDDILFAAPGEAGKKDAKAAMNDAVKRGNDILIQFQKANK
jgi:hypothetical protein